MMRSRKAAPAEPGDLDESLARGPSDPVTAHAALIGVVGKPLFGQIDAPKLRRCLDMKVMKIAAGDLSGAEAMLTAQAETLNMLFLELVRRSHANLDNYLDGADRFMRLAFKAQAQCRSTLESAIAMNNPPVVFANQTNVSAGPQQVNNGVGAPAAGAATARAETSENMPNKLLETNGGQGERLDAGTAGLAIGGDSSLETVGEIDGPAQR